MFSTLFTIALLAVPALADFAVNSPTLTQCQPAHISWAPTKAPYNLIIVADDDQCGDPLVSLGDHDGTSITWPNTTLPAGYKVVISVEDGDGNEAWSQPLTVQPSDDSSCVPSELLKNATSSASSTVSQSSKSSATPLSQAGTTLVVTPTTTVDTSVPASTGSDGVPAPVGAAGADPLGSNSSGTLSLRQSSTPFMIIGAFVAILASSL